MSDTKNKATSINKVQRFLIFIGLVLSIFFLIQNKFNNIDAKFYLKDEICKESVIQVYINNIPLNLEVACTKEQITQGLMFREYLGENEGMIFIFDKPQVLNFWMKNTLIDLDIAFVYFNRIEKIKSMNALSEEIVSSNVLANIAIEMNKGFFEKHGIQQGSEIIFTRSLKNN